MAEETPAAGGGKSHMALIVIGVVVLVVLVLLLKGGSGGSSGGTTTTISPDLTPAEASVLENQQTQASNILGTVAGYLSTGQEVPVQELELQDQLAGLENTNSAGTVADELGLQLGENSNETELEILENEFSQQRATAEHLGSQTEQEQENQLLGGLLSNLGI